MCGCNLQFFSTAVILFQLGRTVYMFFRTVVSVIQNLKLLLKLSLLSFSFDPKWHPNRKNAYTFLGPFWWRWRRAGTHIYLGGGLVLLWVVWQGRRFLKLTSHEFVIPFWFLEYIHTIQYTSSTNLTPLCHFSWFPWQHHAHKLSKFPKMFRSIFWT